MSKNNKQVWLGTDQLESSAEYVKATDNEVAQVTTQDLESPRLESSRRDFLKYLGFGMTAATIASCDIPVRKAIPYVSKPDTIVPGVATYFASTFAQSGDYVPLLVKTREGRPIKVEGNGMSPITQGGTTARAQAAILGLYDTSRFDGPYRIIEGKATSDRDPSNNDGWDIIDGEIMGKLTAGSQIRVVTHTLMSPSTLEAIAEFKKAYPNTEIVQYDPVSSAALLDANQATFGKRAIPTYRFDKAETIVSFGADFLGTWISPVQYARDYVQGRKTNQARMSRHIQVESGMSLTGSNADNRIMVKPSEQGQAILALYGAVVGGGSASLSGAVAEKIAAVGAELKRNRGRSLVVSSSNNLGEQLLVNAINEALGNYGSTIMTDKWSMQRKGDDKAIARFASELEADTIDAVFVLEGANPVYDNPWGATIAANLSKATIAVSLSGVPNDTSVLCNYVAPDHHFLESWGDVEAVEGELSLIQPTITPIFASVGRAGTRQAGESFLIWGKSATYQPDADQPYLEFVKSVWERTAYNRQSGFTAFRSFWDSALHDGVVTLGGGTPFTASTDAEAVPLAAPAAFNQGAVAGAMQRVNVQGTGQEVSFSETINVGNGVFANNPWLQECPDPVTRTVWGNYLTIPVKWEGGNSYTAYNDLNAEEYKGKADIVSLRPGGDKTPADVTVVRQFGQLEDTFSIAVGYGRKVTGMSGRAIGHDIGVNVYPWLPVVDGYVQYYITGAEVSGVVDNEEEFASVQYHHTMGLTTKNEAGAMVYYDRHTGETVEYDRPLTDEEKEHLEPFHVDEKTVMELGEGMQGGLTKRSIIYQGTFAELGELKGEIKERREEAQHLNEQTLYPYEEYAENIYGQGHWWAMHVDLTACIGCAACEVACVAENNVPIVGKYEVWRHHEMKWMRIDRYFYGDVENPRAVYQPMMCQHCDNAPCENVCPVNASQHSNEGLNQMIYNRCIGTRYCANNCPYKVRRFNWLDFTTGDLFSSNEPSVQDEELAFGADNLTRMVLNPDVTVRSRGVIEKCSFCTQRLQAGKLTAKVEGRRLRDSDVRTACQTACPTGAITFGDRNNKQGEVAAKLNNPLNYLALEEVNTQSAVFYAARVHNPMDELV
ncbi:TAT-variant-translocated molybdopterin oxidoreductase [Lewinella sp. 4G2]|uniref:TAT-variant-translocated molybdopterin oxidoreductase n=1 Tax=Lewinella sp. 4G2 TaxID=1803372 RepID=UPI0007B46D52|nr:TAT-variant-translocated molybdopterin oxidoreductase [Lewinella sp. 4G2]OAV44990.1 4Fe-4S ferredoxin [Lewinella sp. 4G2]